MKIPPLWQPLEALPVFCDPEARLVSLELNRVDPVFELARNARLVDEIHVELAQAEEEAIRTSKPARRFKDIFYVTLDS